LTGPFLLVAYAQAGGSIQGRKVWGLTFFKHFQYFTGGTLDLSLREIMVSINLDFAYCRFSKIFNSA
jgi:hypothetical protein